MDFRAITSIIEFTIISYVLQITDHWLKLHQSLLLYIFIVMGSLDDNMSGTDLKKNIEPNFFVALDMLKMMKDLLLT